MRNDRGLLFTLFLTLLPLAALPCPRYKPELARPDYSFYPSSATYIPACSDNADAPKCSKDKPYLILKGTFTKDGSSEIDLFIKAEPPGKPSALWLGVRIEGDKKIHRFKVKEGEVQGQGLGFSIIRGSVTIKEQEGFVFSSDSAFTVPLTVGLLDAEGKVSGKTRTIKPGSGKYPGWAPQYEERHCNKKLPQIPLGQLPIVYPPGDPLVVAPPTTSFSVTPLLVAQPLTFERWLSQHKGGVLACQAALLLFVGLFFSLRKSGSLTLISLGSSMGGAFLGALSFLSIGYLLPEYARDIAPLSNGAALWVLRSGAGFGLVGGALVAIFCSLRFISRFTPSLDLTERSLFHAALWLLVGSLGGYFWMSNVAIVALVFLGSSLVLLALCLVLSWRRLLWLEKVKARRLTGFNVVPYEESFSTEPLVPVLYHPRYNGLCDMVIIQETASQGPYRQKENPLWLFSSNIQGQAYVNYRIVSAVSIGLFLLMGIVGLALL